MGVEAFKDPAAAVNAQARALKWPLHCDCDLVFDRPELNVLRDIWRSKVVGVAVPTHAAFDAKVLDNALRRLTIIERVDDSGRPRYRIRHQGTYLAAVMGSNAGRFIDEGLPPELLPRWTTVFDAVLDSETPMRVVVNFEFAKLNYAVGEALIAPLSNEAGAANVVMIGVYIKPRETEAVAAQ